MKGRENALRDPAIFEDTDGRVYLLYSVAGESGIGIAELLLPP
jgi:beta-xylosidase